LASPSHRNLAKSATHGQKQGDYGLTIRRHCLDFDASEIAINACSAEKNTIQWEDGNEYPVYYVDISSASHPFYTGKQQFVDTMGRVEKFKQKFAGKYGKKKK